MEERACQYCGRVIAVNVHAHHESKCMHGPAGQRVREFIQSNLVDGGIMQKTAYRNDPRRRELGLPDDKAMMRHLGMTWREFAAWCGVPYKVQLGRGVKAYHIRRVDAEIAASQAALTDYDGILVINRGVKPVWNWSRMQYDECAVMELK